MNRAVPLCSNAALVRMITGVDMSQSTVASTTNTQQNVRPKHGGSRYRGSFFVRQQAATCTAAIDRVPEYTCDCGAGCMAKLVAKRPNLTDAITKMRTDRFSTGAG